MSKKYRLGTELKSLVRVINQALNEWEGLGVKPNEVRYAEDLIEDFNEWTGKPPKQSDRLSNRKKYTEEQIDELKDIALSLAEKKIVVEQYYSDEFISNYEKAKENNNDINNLQDFIDSFESRFEKAKGKRGIETMSDYISFINQKDIFLKEKLIASVMNYYDYKDIQEKYRRVKSKRKKPVTDEEINNYIIKQYNKKGYVGNDLYEFIYKKIR